MKKVTVIGILFLMMMSFNASAQKEKKDQKSKKNTTEMKLETKLDSVSYGLGINIAENLKNQGLDSLNVEALAKGMVDYLSNGDLLISKEAVMPLLNEYMQGMQEAKMKSVIDEGKNFLAENGKREGVITLPSGLQYEVLQAGNGATPTSTDKVTTHYTGTLIDGTVFDSSVQRGQPATFPVNGVIKGWTEALQLMKEGAKWKLFIPYDLAYGERGAGANIGPYSTLIFEIELIKVN